MTYYVYRPWEPGPRLPVAPYVMRPDIDPHPRQWTDEQRAGITKPFNPDLCGELAGYRQHVRFKQEKCPACKAALARENARIRANRAAREAEC